MKPFRLQVAEDIALELADDPEVSVVAWGQLRAGYTVMVLPGGVVDSSEVVEVLVAAPEAAKMADPHAGLQELGVRLYQWALGRYREVTLAAGPSYSPAGNEHFTMALSLVSPDWLDTLSSNGLSLVEVG